ncbi:MAG: glycosyl transferase family 2 [Halobacteriaceae archaeon]
MDYAQERVPTCHDFGAADPAAPVGRTAVVVPMTEREYAGLAAEGVLSALERADPGRVVVPLDAPAERVGPFVEWLDGFDVSLEVCWCGGSRLAALLADHGLDGPRGKGRDVWLGLGLALAGADYVACHDADTVTYEARDLRKLCYPLDRGFSFSKGYYARVENDRLYGRLCRLFYEPVVTALREVHDADVLDYLDAFRYALAGEFAATADLARSMRVPRGWGLEVATLGEAFDVAGFAGSAQVDLGRYEHAHRAVSGPTGLSEMSEGVGATLFRVVGDRGVDVDFDRLRERYDAVADRLVRAYETDAGFNGLDFDPAAERDQVETYAGAVTAPGPADRLPAWGETDLDPAAVREAVAADRESVT